MHSLVWYVLFLLETKTLPKNTDNTCLSIVACLDAFTAIAPVHLSPSATKRSAPATKRNT